MASTSGTSDDGTEILSMLDDERTTKVATGVIVSDAVLDELVVALSTSLNRVSASALNSSTARQQWQQVQAWLVEAKRFSQQKENHDQFVRLKPFPLSGAELRALQVAVNRASNPQERTPVSAEQADLLHSQQIAAAPDTPLTQLHRGLRHLHVSSIALLVILGATVVLNLFALVVLHVSHPSWTLYINVAAAGLALGVWLFHERHLRDHIFRTHQHHPHPTQ